MGTAVVYFLTFSTYGTRLLGRDKGSWRWDGTFYEANEALHCYMKNLRKYSQVTFEALDQAIVHDAIVDCCRQNGWEIDALNVRTEHVHIILFARNGETSTEIVRKLKTSATLALWQTERRQKGLPVWTIMFAETKIWSMGFWRRKVEYTLHEQGDNDYLHLSRFGQEKIREIRSVPRKEKVKLEFLYGGEDRANIRAAFFLRRAKQGLSPR